MVEQFSPYNRSNFKGAVGGGHAQIFHQHLDGGSLTLIDITNGPNVHEVDVVKGIGVRGHFGIANHHAHPTCVEIGCCVAFCKIVPGGIGWQEGTGKADGRQVRFVDVAFHARNTVLK